MKYRSKLKLSKVFAITVLTIVVSAISMPVSSAVAVAITVVPVKYVQISTPIKNSGRISHKNEMRLSFKTGGLIKKINVEEGDAVKAGQVLAMLDLEEIDAQHKRATANFTQASADLERFNRLYDDALVSLQDKQNAQSANDTAASELQIVNFNRKLSVIRAPVDGRILKRHAESNELIQSNQPVLLLASVKHGSVLRVGLIDQDIVKVALGDPAVIFLDAYPSKTFSGVISQVALSTESAVGTFEVEVLINTQGYTLHSGLIARVEISPQLNNTQYIIPVESVYKAEHGVATVFVLDEGENKVTAVDVKIVTLLQEEVVVEGGLDGTDLVIKTGTAYLSDGSTVVVVDGIELHH